MKIIMLLTLFCISHVAMAQQCTSNNFFEEAGWNTHSRENFQLIAETIQSYVKNNKDYLKDDITSFFYSEELEQLVFFKSLDDIRTPEKEMFGDIVILSSTASDDILEIRWYEKNVKHISYNTNLLQCASDLIPYAENTLF